MSPLTKAFVVLVTLLSIVLVTLVIPFVAQTSDLNEQISDLKASVAAAEAATENAKASAAASQAAIGAKETALNTSLIDLRGENKALAAEVGKQTALVSAARSEVDKLTASIALQTNSQSQLTALLGDRTEVLTGAQTQNVSLKKENAQLAQRNNDLDATVTGLERTVRLLKEQIADLQSGPGGGSGDIAVASAQIRGAITDVQTLNGLTLVQLNVGSNDDVSSNAKFVIFRGNDEYVGTATIKSVDANVSVAHIDSASSSPRVGDAAMTGVNY